MFVNNISLSLSFLYILQGPKPAVSERTSKYKCFKLI